MPPDRASQAAVEGAQLLSEELRGLEADEAAIRDLHTAGKALANWQPF